MPDPNPEIQWGQLEDAPGWDAAWQACKQLLPPGPTSPPPSAQDMKRLLAYAVCMRARHIVISDSDPNTGNMNLTGHTRTDRLFTAAHTACKDKLLGATGDFGLAPPAKHRR